MRPLRACIVVPYDLDEEGGVKKHAVHLASKLRARGDHVEIFGPDSGRGPLPPFTRGFRGVINIPSNGSDNHLGIFVCPWLVHRRLREGRYDVVHVMEPAVPSLAVYAAWFARPAARIATFHAFSEEEGRASRIARRLLSRPQLRLFDRGIAVSPAAARFAGVIWPRPLAIIPNGIDTTLFRPPADDRAPGPLRLLFVGHFRDPRKGLPVLLGALGRLHRAGVPATLDVIGSGPAPAPAAAGDHVTYHGAIRDEERLAAWYRACDVFVAPSLGMESFGIVLLEAMASARAIVCSDIEGYRHVVPRAGARLVPPGDEEALALALRGLAGDAEERGRMGRDNRLAALGYDWAQVAERVRQEYVLALAGRGPRA